MIIRTIRRRSIREAQHSWGSLVLRAQGGHLSILRGTGQLDPPEEGTYVAVVPARLYRDAQRTTTAPTTENQSMPTHVMRRHLGDACRTVDTSQTNPDTPETTIIAHHGKDETVALVTLNWLAWYLSETGTPTSAEALKGYSREPQPV